MEPVKQESYRGYAILMVPEEYPADPRKEWDNLGTMTTWHRRYRLGDEQTKEVEDLRAKVGSKDVFYLPLYLLDHSGITMSTRPFHDPWDSGLVGYIWVDKAAVLQEYGVKRISRKVRQKVLEVLEGEVRTYDQYLTGEVYGRVVRDPESHVVDSVWGFYGADGWEDMLVEAKSFVDWHIEANAGAGI